MTATPAARFAALSLLAAGPAVGQSIIVNGSFEAVTNGTIDHWVQVLDATSQPAASYGSASPYGNLLLALNAGGLPGNSATQDFAPLVAGETYLVEFAYAQHGGAAGEQTLTVTINSTSVPVPQQFFTDATPTSDIATGWERGSFTFVSSGFDSGITFSDPTSLGAGSSVLLIDDVSLTLIPEPAGAALLALCGGGALFRRRRGGCRSGGFINP